MINRIQSYDRESVPGRADSGSHTDESPAETVNESTNGFAGQIARHASRLMDLPARYPAATIATGVALGIVLGCLIKRRES